MTARPIVMLPDPRLRQAAAPVAVFDEALHQLAQDLLDTMRAAPGIGITAPHVGVLLRLVVIDLPGGEGPRFYVNPLVEWASAETARHAEGSVSMPGVSEEVERPARVRVRFRTLDGGEKVEEADGLLAVCLQHEIDQLDGLFWIGRLSRLKRERAVRRYEKLRRVS
ncbi:MULTISPECIES: peptide deformylase [unclassified Chelatococcus]|uniref:peptide deformylase n=1 Tax=unclassified Chelatococcus TaxID=2638111 RepID=UPI000303C52C|nr:MULTISPECIES: peptide deformylase [unclassified Chelatococcus]ALA17449.1 peptide deformylase [Chelatococcus sp. CO-6]